MKLLKNKQDVNRLVEALENCRSEVLLCSCDGHEQYNLKDDMGRNIGIGELCKDSADTYEMFCMDRDDECYMLKFFNDIREAA